MDIEKFWNDCHRKETIAALSGVSYDETVDFLKVRNLIKPGIRVLEVGVGLGYVTKGLYDKEILVSCLDISEVAVERVKDYCENIYMIEDLEKLPSDYFDIILCNNVVQHVSTELLVGELKHLIRSLKESGIFSVEFVSNSAVEDTGINASLVTMQGGGCCRTPQYLEKMINTVGGECELVFNSLVPNNPTVTDYYVFHVTKKG